MFSKMALGCFPFGKKEKIKDELTDNKINDSLHIREPVVTENLIVPQMNPFEMDDILTKLFEYFSIQSLQSARGVSKQWNRISTRLMLTSYYVTVPDKNHHHHFCPHREEVDQSKKEKKGMELKQVVKNLTKLSIPIKNIKIQSPMAVEIFQDVHILTKDIRKLKLEFPETTSSHENIRSTNQLVMVMDELPCLEYLETNCLDLSNRPFWDGTRKSNFLNKLAHLKELRIKGEIDQNTLKVYDLVRDNLKALKEIRLNETATEDFIRIFVNNPSWASQVKIDNVSLKINLEVGIALTRRFLRLVSPTLKCLRMSFVSWEDKKGHRIPKNKVADNWYIPLSLTNLTELTINESVGSGEYSDDRRIKSATWRSLLTTLQLPKLKELTIGAHYAGRMDDLYNEWVHRGKDAKDFSCPSLETLGVNLAVYLRDSSLFTSIAYTLWPNLKSLFLIVNLQEPIPTMLTAIFNKMKNLQHLRLELTPNNDEEDDDEDYDSDEELGLVSGFSWDMILSGQQQKDQKMPSLRDLKELKILCIECRQRDLISDSLVYNELVHLKDLEHLHIMGAGISGEAAWKLEDSLTGVNVKVECGHTFLDLVSFIEVINLDNTQDEDSDDNSEENNSEDDSD